MFRASAKYLISAAEASNFLSVTAPKALATDNSSARQKLIPTMMEIFNDHPINASVVSQTVQLMTQIDQEASDSFAIAQHSECLRVLVSDVMKKNIHNVEIKEHCCRAIANVCLLPNDTFDILNGGGANVAETTSTSSSKSSDSTAQSQPSSAPKAFADVAVELGAIETVIGTMSHVSRLSEKGRCWTATALQNLLMFATTPQATLRAGKAGAEEVLSTFLIEMCHDASATMSDIQNEVRRAGGNTETERVAELAVTLQRLLIAMDAASVSLARLMNAPAEENANNIDTRAQTASANVIDAALRTMITTLGVATVLTKVQTNDLKYVAFSNPELAKVRDEIALPVLHKGWEVVKAIAAHKKNLPVIFNAIAEVNSDFEGMFSRNEPWLRAASAPAPSSDPSVTNTASASANPTGHQQAVNHILEVVVNHAMLQIAPLVSFSSPTTSEVNNNNNNNVSRLAFDAALSAITDLIAPRTDITAEEASSSSSSTTSTTDAASSTSHHNNNHGEDDIPVADVVNDSESVGYGSESGGVSRSVPTENAATAIGCIANGVAANTAVTAIPKQWRALIEMVEAEGNTSSAAADKRRRAAISSSQDKNSTTEDIDSEEKNVLQRQYDTVRDACGFFGLLSNLADAGDAVASGPNAVAVASSVLLSYLSQAQKASFRLAQNTTLNASSSVQNAKIPPAQILLENLEAQHNEVVAIQRLLIPVVGKAFTLVWNAVGTPQGSDAVRTLEVAQCVQSINKTTSMLVQTLQTRLNELLAQQVEAFEKDSSSSASGSTPPPATPSAIIDGLQELERVGLQLYQKLDAIVVNPVYAQDKHTKKE